MDHSGGAGARGGPWISTNQGIASCIAGVTGLLLVHLLSTEWVYRELRDGFRLGFFTLAATFAMLLCALVMIVDRRRHEVEEGVARTHWSGWLVAIVMMAMAYLYFHLAWRIDFLLVTPIFLLASTYALGIRPLRSAALAAVITTVMLYGLFRLIGIHLPTNVLGL